MQIEPIYLYFVVYKIFSSLGKNFAYIKTDNFRSLFEICYFFLYLISIGSNIINLK